MDKLKDITIINSDMTVRVGMKRINENLKKAQYWLDSQIMTDMVPYMPMNTGTFINVTRARSAALAGSGLVAAAAAPMGRYLYYGKVMVDVETGKGPMKIPGVGLRFHKGAKLVATDRPLTYSNPSARPEWFEVAKEKNLKKWIQGVREKVDEK